MPTAIDRNRVRELLEAQNAQLVEVLPRTEFDEEHLPGAVSLPLKTMDVSSTSVLDPARPVIVYCWDTLCDLSSRAAWRLERIGFHVYDYAAGKVDWLAAGLPTTGAQPHPRRAIDVAERDPATCEPDTAVADLPSDSDVVVVVSKDGIVLGRVRLPVEAAAETPVGELMEPGPATVRAHEPLDDLLDRMGRRHVKQVIVTTPEGRLLGVVHAS
jgi:rhodanese-related sulfurtransferase